MSALASRRGILAGLAAAPFGGAVIASRIAEPDAALLALGARFEAAWAHERAVDARYEGDRSDEADKACTDAWAATEAIADEIEGVRPSTMAGLYVRARVLLWCMAGDPLSPEQFSDAEPTTDVRFVTAIAQDVLRIGAPL